MPATLRPARLADAATLGAIEAEVFPDPWSIEAFRSSIRAPATQVLVAEAGGEILGYAVLFVAADEAEVANIAVAPEARGRGVGRRLLDAMLTHAAEAGARTAYLEVRVSNAVAQRLYERAGFAVVGRRRRYYQQPDEDALVMRTTLAPPVSAG